MVYIVELIYLKNDNSNGVLKSEVNCFNTYEEQEQFIMEKFEEMLDYKLFFKSKEDHIKYSNLKWEFSSNRNKRTAYDIMHDKYIINEPYLPFKMNVWRYAYHGDNTDNTRENSIEDMNEKLDSIK